MIATAAFGMTPLQTRACARRRAGRSGPRGPEAMMIGSVPIELRESHAGITQPSQGIEGDEPAGMPADDDMP